MKYTKLFLALAIVGLILAAGCVERKLTIVTNPSDAVVWLNDEEIGRTPVTVNFKWYGDYRVLIEKAGYEITNTHQTMKRPLHDVFPFDFFAECLWPGRIVDTYTWNYQLATYQAPSSEELIKSANTAKASFQQEINEAQKQIDAEKSKKK
jgi:hypothetical protein